MITYDAYFSFVLQILIGLGLSFEIPLVITILAAFGLITPAALNRFRRFEIVLAFAAGALLSPGADVLSMLMMTVPILLLYEIGVGGAMLMHRRRLRRAASAAAQGSSRWRSGAPRSRPRCRNARSGRRKRRRRRVRRRPRPANDADSLTRAKVQSGQAVDTAAARRLGLPTGPVFPFPAPDSTMQALLQRQGYVVTRYRADSVTLLAEEKRILMVGEARTEREGATLEASEIDYQDAKGMLDARGSPMLFSEGNILVGKEIRYYTESKRGVVTGALTSFDQGGAEWFLRGSIAQDSSSKRIYAQSSEITSCDLPDPHYHFSAGEVKWISGTVMVARPDRALRARRPGHVAAVRLPGRPARPSLGHPDSAHRLQRRRADLGEVQSPDHEHRVLLGGERLLRHDRPLRLARQSILHPGGPGTVSVAGPIHERIDWLQSTVGQRGRALHRRDLGPPAGLLAEQLPESLAELCDKQQHRPKQRDRSPSDHPADHQRPELHPPLCLGHPDARRQSPAEHREQQPDQPAAGDHAQPEAGQYRLERDLVAGAVVLDRMAAQAAVVPPDGGDPAQRAGRHAGQHLRRAEHHLQPRNAAPHRELQLAEQRPRDRPGAGYPHHGWRLGARYGQPRGLGLRDDGVQRDLLHRTRLGHRHQSPAALPRLLEAPAVGGGDQCGRRTAVPDSQSDHRRRMGRPVEAVRLQHQHEPHVLRLLPGVCRIPASAPQLLPDHLVLDGARRRHPGGLRPRDQDPGAERHSCSPVRAPNA